MGIGVGSCCQGRWCVILSPLCLLPVGQGLLEQGVVDSTEWRGGEGSQQARKESGQTHSATVAGQQLGYLAPIFFCYFSSVCYSFSPAESSDWTNAGKQPRVASEKPVSALRWGAHSDSLRSGLRCCRCRDVRILRVQKSPLKNTTTLRSCCLFLGN